jgi:hypothetical protein
VLGALRISAGALRMASRERSNTPRPVPRRSPGMTGRAGNEGHERLTELRDGPILSAAAGPETLSPNPQIVAPDVAPASFRGNRRAAENCRNAYHYWVSCILPRATTKFA